MRLKKTKAKNDTDPLSRLGLIIGMLLGLFLCSVQETYEYTYGRMDTNGQKLELAIVQPERPEIGKVRRYFCAPTSNYARTSLPICSGDRISVLASTGARHGVSVYVLASMALFESTAGLYGCGYNWWGYASCAVRFTSFDEAVDRVAATFAGYGRGARESLAVWHTGRTIDDSGYPERVIGVARDIEGVDE